MQVTPAKLEKEITSSVGKSALQMSFGTLLSRVLGLGRELAFAALFPRMVTDAWIAAFRLPNLFRRLLGEGTLSISFIPVYIGLREKSHEEAQKFLNAFWTLLLVVLTTLCVLGSLWPEKILTLLLDENFRSDAEKFLMTVRMARIMFSFIFFISIFALWMGIHNSLKSFRAPALAPTLFNVILIISTLLPLNWFSSAGDGLAWGVVLGGAAQAAFLLPGLIRRGIHMRFSFAWRNPGVSAVLKNMLPAFLGLGLMQVTTLVNLRFASELGEGTLSWIAWADRLLELPLSLIAVSLGTALLPTLSTHWTQNRKDEMVKTLDQYLGFNFFLCCAAAVGLFILAEPIISVLFERGHFSRFDTVNTAAVLQIWALMMIPASAVRVITPAYSSCQKNHWPAIVSCVCLAAHLILAPWMMRHWGLTGLNLSTLVSASLNLIGLILLFPSQVHAWKISGIFLRCARFVPALLVLGLSCWITERIYFNISGFLLRAGFLFSAIAISGGIYLAIARLMNLPEAGMILRRFVRK